MYAFEDGYNPVDGAKSYFDVQVLPKISTKQFSTNKSSYEAARWRF